MSGGGPVGRVPLADILRDLSADIERLASELLPLGRRHGGEWQEAPTRLGGLGDSFSVRLAAPRAGIWSHFAAGRSGDALDLIAYLKTGGDKSAAIRWAKEWLGIEDGIGGGGGRKPDPALDAAARQQREKRTQQAASEHDWKVRRARALWLGAPKLGAGDVVDRYLSGRGIGPSRLGRAPGCLRAGQSILHRSGVRWPAMLAAIVAPEGGMVAVHRTFLTAEGRKAPVDPVKMVLGEFRGCHVPVWKGQHRQPLHAIPAGVAVHIAEGIEDALSVALLLPEVRVVAAVSIGNLAAIVLPPQVGEVVLIGQNDPETLPNGRPHPTIEAMERAIEAHSRHGRLVRLARPPAGIKDFNEWVQRLAGEAK